MIFLSQQVYTLSLYLTSLKRRAQFRDFLSFQCCRKLEQLEKYEKFNITLLKYELQKNLKFIFTFLQKFTKQCAKIKNFLILAKIKLKKIKN